MTQGLILNKLLDEIGHHLIISSNGLISRELYDLRKKRKEPTTDFYMQGSMGCAVPIGLGVALGTRKEVIVLTGDGALLMKLGSLATVSKFWLRNLHIIVFNNQCHQSTGGQPTSFNSVKYLVGKICWVFDVIPEQKELNRPEIGPVVITENFMKKVKEDDVFKLQGRSSYL